MSETRTAERDETPQEGADRCASAISTYIAALAYRAAHGPLNQISEQEREAFHAMRDELRHLASHAYDCGYRAAMNGKREPADVAR